MSVTLLGLCLYFVADTNYRIRCSNLFYCQAQYCILPQTDVCHMTLDTVFSVNPSLRSNYSTTKCYLKCSVPSFQYEMSHFCAAAAFADDMNDS